MTATLRVGIVGCGRVARMRHLPVLRRLPGVEVTALADTDAAALRAVAEEFGVAGRFRDTEELLAGADVDLVAVCVPALSHAEVATAALEAGKHVYVEKPLALTLEDCDAILGCVGTGQRAFVGFHLRHHRLVRQARELLRAGVTGPVEIVRSEHTGFYRDIPAWRKCRATGGGVLFEQAVHHFDLWRFLLSTEVREVYASVRSDEWEDVSAAVTARLANGAVVSALFCERTTAANELAVLGRDGRLRLSGYRFDGLRFEPTSTEPGSISARLADAMHTLRHVPDAFSSGRSGGEYQRAFLEHWRHCCQVLRGEARQECTLEDGRRAVEVVLAAAESDRTGRPVAIGAT